MAKSEYDLVLNVMAPRNRWPHFYPMQKALRGTIRMSEIRSDRPNGALLRLGMEIPGLQLQVDMKLNHVKVIDRMTLPEFREKDRALRQITREEAYMRFAFSEYEKDFDTQVPANEWPTWLWHIRCLVDHKRFHIVSGVNALPSKLEILKMVPPEGRTRIQIGDSCDLKPSDKDRPFYMLDARDAEQLEATGAI